MAKKIPVILPPTSPRLAAELESFSFTAIDADEWLDISDSIVAKELIENVKKLRIEKSKLVGTILSSLNLDKCELSDAVVEGAALTALRTYRAQFQRVTFGDTRATGADFAEAYFEDCVFKDMKFDETGFRMAQFKRVRFENCVLTKADFYHATLTHVSFENCELEQTNFDQAICKSVDLRGENLSLIQGVLGLKHATISQEQLIQISPLLAYELGFVMEDDDST